MPNRKPRTTKTPPAPVYKPSDLDPAVITWMRANNVKVQDVDIVSPTIIITKK